MRNSTLISVAALLAAVAGLQAAPPAQPAPVVPVEKVESISESAGKKYVGHLEAIEEVELRAAHFGVTSTRSSSKRATWSGRAICCSNSKIRLTGRRF